MQHVLLHEEMTLEQSYNKSKRLYRDVVLSGSDADRFSGEKHPSVYVPTYPKLSRKVLSSINAPSAVYDSINRDLRNFKNNQGEIIIAIDEARLLIPELSKKLLDTTNIDFGKLPIKSSTLSSKYLHHFTISPIMSPDSGPAIVAKLQILDEYGQVVTESEHTDTLLGTNPALFTESLQSWMKGEQKQLLSDIAWHATSNYFDSAEVLPTKPEPRIDILNTDIDKMQSIITQHYAFLRYEHIQKPIMNTVGRIHVPLTVQDLESVDAETFELQGVPDILLVKQVITYIQERTDLKESYYNLDSSTFSLLPKNGAEKITIDLNNFLTIHAVKHYAESQMNKL
jgi:hypothetical protein